MCEDNCEPFRQYVPQSTDTVFKEQEFYYEEQCIAVNTQYIGSLFLLYWSLSLNTLKRPWPIAELVPTFFCHRMYFLLLVTQLVTQHGELLVHVQYNSSIFA